MLVKKLIIFSMLIYTGIIQQECLAANIALLVGVAEYPHVKPLSGPTHDVREMRSVLNRKWGFDLDNIHTLVNEQATQKNIIKALTDLKVRSKAGDQILIYFSGHGTSRQDQSTRYPLPYNSGAFVPYDFDTRTLNATTTKDPVEIGTKLNNSLIIGRQHLYPLISELEKDRSIVVILDTCYSANTTRSLSLAPIKTQSRNIALPNLSELGVKKTDQDLFQKQFEQRPEPYPYQNTISIAASGEDQEAADLDVGKFDGQPHGLLTDILLQVLEGKISADINSDGQVSYSELRQVLAESMMEYPVKIKQTPLIQPLISEDKNNITFNTLLKSRSITVEAGELEKFSSETPLFKIAVQNLVSKTTLEKMLGSLNLSISNKGDHEFNIIEHNPQSWTLTNAALEPISENTTLSVIHQRLGAEIWLRELQNKFKNDANLELAATPEFKGNGFNIGDQFQYLVKSQQDQSLLLFNIDSGGGISLLYPIDSNENKIMNKKKVFITPKIRVGDPIGLDTVVAISFSKPIDTGSLNYLLSIAEQKNSVILDYSIINRLNELFEKNKQIGFQKMTLRTYPQKGDNFND